MKKDREKKREGGGRRRREKRFRSKARDRVSPTDFFRLPARAEEEVFLEGARRKKNKFRRL